MSCFDKMVRSGSLEVHLEGDRCICLVPSIHTYHEFALAVRSIPVDYDAVTLEMDPWTSREFVRLITKHAPTASSRLPGCLAVAQVAGGAAGQSATLSIVPLVATDSQCEAARIAVQMGLPVFGIDCQVTDSPSLHSRESQPGAVFPESAAIRTSVDLDRYVSVVGRLAPMHGDCGVLAHRNRHMVGRLWEITREYPRVLAVVGLAHYPGIVELLRGGSYLGWTELAGPARSIKCEPVLLSPELALPQMDRFPRIVDAYETARNRAGALTDELCFDAQAVTRQAIGEAVAACEDCCNPRELMAFLQLLDNGNALTGRVLPRLSQLVQAARATMDRFEIPLAEALTRFPWSASREFPYRQLETESDTSADWVRLGARRIRLAVPLSGEVRLSIGKDRYPSCHRWRTWPPEDRIASLMALQLATGSNDAKELTSEPIGFDEAGSMLGGIDVRGTVRRVASRHRCALAVRESNLPQLATDLAQPRWPFPVLYLFHDDLSQDSKTVSWYAPFADHGRRTSRRFHTIVGFAKMTEFPWALRANWDAVIHFVPLMWADPHLYGPQADRYLWQDWIADHPGRLPVGGTSVTNIHPRLAADKVTALDLVRVALSYTHDCLTVVLPASSRHRGSVMQIAGEYGTQVKCFDTERLSQASLGRIRQSHLVPWEYGTGELWLGGAAAPGVESKMRESENAFRGSDFGLLSPPVCKKPG